MMAMLIFRSVMAVTIFRPLPRPALAGRENGDARINTFCPSGCQRESSSTPAECLRYERVTVRRNNEGSPHSACTKVQEWLYPAPTLMNALYHNFRGLSCVLTFCAWTAIPVSAFPPGPTPQVPAGGGPPGAFPNTSVSAVNVVARGNSAAFDGRVEITAFEGRGPIPWTISRYNRGDFAMRLAPANPAGADANTLNMGFIDFLGANDASRAENQAWRPHPRLGVAIPTARQNGPINWGDGEGDFYPTVGIGAASSGYGYSMLDGSFGQGQLDINTGRAGTHASSPEANFSFSVAWFPYDAGWIAGNVGSPSATGAPSWAGAGEHATGLVPRLITWSEFPSGSGTYAGLGMLRLPGVNAVSNGMLFATSSDGASDVNIVGVAPTNEISGGSGWIITVREDAALLPEEVAVAGQSEFEFVYIPFTAPNLIGGYIDGLTGTSLQSTGTFTLTRSDIGTYRLSISGKSASSGTLLLQVAELEEGTSVPMASRAFISYQYDSGSGEFVIQSQKQFDAEVTALVDVSFYFAWIDFANPVQPPDGPRLRNLDQVVVTDSTSINAKEGNMAVNTDEPEVLVTTIDQNNSAGYLDLTTALPAIQAMVGYFYDPRTLTRTRGPFFIMGNSSGQITRHDVKYNPFSREYVVVGNARAYGAGGQDDLLMISRVSPNSVAGANEPLISVFVYDGISDGQDYDDVSVAVSPRNGNFIVAAEHKVLNEGEGVYGILFGPDGAPLTTSPTRLDVLQPTGDEDDPDIVYLPLKDVFLYTANTDLSGGLVNRVAGSIIQTTDNGGALQISGGEQPLTANTGSAHPASIENPFNGEIITAFDFGNDTSRGSLSYYNVGAGPSYSFSEARPEVPYLAGPATGNPLRHQHPQIAVDVNSGAFVVGYQARNSTVGLPQGYVFSVLDADGAVMPSQLGAPYYLIDALTGAVDTGPNYHNIKYDPFSDSFLAVATAGASGANAVYLASVTVTSSHAPPRPSLSIVRGIGNNVIIRWPASATGYVLTSTASLSSPSWSTVGGTPMQNGAFMEMTVPIGAGDRFFRLEK